MPKRSPQLAVNSEGVASLSISNQKGNLGGFNPVINNYILSFNSFVIKVKVKMNGF